ncbi:hypothetical protein FZEAL_5881 [Fusarium zealandicum]|uniref:Uncharacterized protein n=1 Tax=Fusarium zealandicum TaxID=1053134 RepID=A0A8H4UJM1_9HYPO|nr:hypothetical protein FZEAL_5881 [Fusarium zealandicum]
MNNHHLTKPSCYSMYNMNTKYTRTSKGRSPDLDFVAPFKDKGRIEVMTGLTGAGGECIRIIRGDSSDPRLCDIVLVPFRHIEQAVIIPGSSQDGPCATDGLFQVLIVPTAATGASAAKKRYPQIIRFSWPDREVDDQGHVRRETDKDASMYLAAVKTTLNQQLVAYYKQVIVYTREEQAQGQPPMFNLSANNTSASESHVERGQGSFFFLPTGILWLGESAFYLTFDSFNYFMLIFCKDAASKTAENDCPTVAMDLLVQVSEPYYQAKNERSEQAMLNFSDVPDYSSVARKIQNYAWRTTSRPTGWRRGSTTTQRTSSCLAFRTWGMAR